MDRPFKVLLAVALAVGFLLSPLPLGLHAAPGVKQSTSKRKKTTGKKKGSRQTDKSTTKKAKSTTKKKGSTTKKKKTTGSKKTGKRTSRKSSSSKSTATGGFASFLKKGGTRQKPIGVSKNYKPPTGKGRFDVYVSSRKQSGADLIIRVKFKHEFTRRTWPAAERSATIKRFESLIESQWNNRFEIICSKKTNGWPGNYPIRVVFDPQSVTRGQHFIIEWDPDKTSNSAKVSVPPTYVGYFNMTALHSVPEVQKKQRSRVRDWMSGELPSFGGIWSPIIMTAPRTGVSPATKFLAQTFADTVSDCCAKPSAAVIVLSHFGSTGASQAAKIRALLKDCGLKSNSYEIRTQTKPGFAKVSSGVQVFADNASLGAKKAGFGAGSLAADMACQLSGFHEFGHIVGFPDEYYAPTNSTVRYLRSKKIMTASEASQRQFDGQKKPGKSTTDTSRAQKAMIDLCLAAGVRPPTFGPPCSNVMSSGSAFRAMHGVIAWDALAKKIATYGVKRSDLKIKLITSKRAW